MQTPRRPLPSPGVGQQTLPGAWRYTPRWQGYSEMTGLFIWLNTHCVQQIIDPIHVWKKKHIMYGAFSHCLRGSYGWINLNATFKERKQLVDPWDNLTVNYENTLPRVKSNCIQRLTLVILPDDRRDGWIKAEQSSASSFVSDRNEKQSCPEADAARSQLTVSCAFSLLNFKEPDKCVCRSELWLKIRCTLHFIHHF